jgi:sigma-B regulation protein RsbU (phosphoserine phosphatase)
LLAAALNNARLDAKRVESEHVQRQLRLAADVQKRMLPQQWPQFPPFEVAARNIPSLELSGDFYDLIDLSGNLGIAVADVAGKGVPASLMMASVRSSLRAFAQDVYDIDHIMARVNAALTRDTLPHEFATLFYGVLDPRTGRLTYCNAGHEPPLLLHAGKFTQLEAGGMIVGIDPKATYERGIVFMKPGDLLLIYTDGLTEAQDFGRERFGRQRIMQAMRDMADKPAREALNHVLWQMRRFVGLNRTSDDTTLVAVKYTK